MYGWRAAAAGLGIVVAPLALYLAPGGPSLGKGMFAALSLLGFGFALFGGVVRTADSLAEEKRENTLGLLFLTDLKAGDILAGKFFASGATLVFGLMAMLPLLAIPVLLGGVTPGEVARVALSLLNTLFYSVAAGFLVSTVVRQGGLTILAGLVLMAGMGLGWPMLAERFFGTAQPSGPMHQALLFLSPLPAVAIAINSLVSHSFWQAMVVSHCVGWIALLGAARRLPKMWQETPGSRRTERWRARGRSWQFGSAAARQKFRRRLLKSNPLFWLSGREQVSSAGLMAVLMLMGSVSLVGHLGPILVCLAAMHATLLVRMASAASHALAEDRKSGALELLLATPLTVREVLRGRWMGLGRQFFGPILIVTLWHLFAIRWISELEYNATIFASLVAGLFTMAAAWIATGWVGMWAGLRARHPLLAIWGCLGVVVVAPALCLAVVFNALAYLKMLPRVWIGEQAFFAVGALFLWAVYLFFLIERTQRRVKGEFREAATDRFSDTRPYDWRPALRTGLKIAGALTVIVGGIWGYRAHIDSRGERELMRTLAAHPAFQLEEPEPVFFAQELNLAQWGALIQLNDLTLRNAWGLRGAPGRGGLEDVLAGVGPMSRSRTKEERARDQDAARQRTELAIEELHAAARRRPHLRFSLAPKQWPDDVDRTGHHPYLRNLVGHLAQRAAVRQREGKPAVEDALLAVRFANCVTNEPEALGTHQALLFQAVRPIHQGLRAGKWSEEELGRLQEAFEAIDCFAQFYLCRDHMIRFMANEVGAAPAGTMAGVGMHPMRDRGESRMPGKVKLRKARIIEAGLEKLPKVYDGGKRIIVPGSIPSGTTPRITTEPLIIPLVWGQEEAARLAAETQTVADQAAIACAIERFRLATGRIPERLEELAPRFMARVPHDLATGQGMIYRAKGDRFELYSVALDGKDNGGRKEVRGGNYSPVQNRQPVVGDWVWFEKD